jgi:hypothetical protein
MIELNGKQRKKTVHTIGAGPLYWPERQVLLFLKQRSRVFSLHVDEPLLDDPSVSRRPIMLHQEPAPP